MRTEKKKRKRKLGLATLVVALAGGSAVAQAPDAGRLLREATPPPAPPQPAPPLRLRTPIPVPPAALPGGVRIQVTAVRIEGLATLPAEDVLARLGPVGGREYDFAGLRELAARVQALVRETGLPFARAYLPPQDLAGGVLRIGVVEGRFGEVRATGPDAAAGQPWLEPLQPGDYIRSRELERTLLLLQGLPGVQASSTLSPGTATGTGDLTVEVSHQRQWRGEVGFDNHGNRYSGRGRVRGQLEVDSPFTFGDRFAADGYLTQEGTWLGHFGYQQPLGHGGWQGQLGFSRTDYELGKEFAAAQAHGTADVFSAGATYPLVRTQRESLRVAAGWNHKRLRDVRGAASLDDRKRSNVLPLAVSADRVDASGVSWASATLGIGWLDLDDTLAATDRTTARTEGRFAKLNVDAARHHYLGQQWTLRVRGSAQWASRNLDSSEKFVLGGPYGVRAWPNGEGGGDSGWMLQLELRYRWQWLEPFVLLEASHVRVNRKPWAAGDNERSLHGAGAGVRFSNGPWLGEVSLAWRVGGNRRPLVEPNANQPLAWVSVGYRF